MELGSTQGPKTDKGNGTSARGSLRLAEVFKRNEQHSEAFTVFFSDVLVMHLMSSPQCTEVRVLRVTHDFQSLVNEDVMNEEIGHPI